MSWTFTPYDQDDTIKEILETWDPRSIHRRALVGNNLWLVVGGSDHGKPVRYVALYLMAEYADGMWGYKEMDETAGPYYYDCPSEFLDDLTEPLNAWSRDWREKVRLYKATGV